MGCTNSEAQNVQSNNQPVNNNAIMQSKGSNREGDNVNPEIGQSSLRGTATIRKIDPKKKPGMFSNVEQFCQQIFSRHDRDKNGYLTLKEFRVLLKEYVADDLTERQIRNLRKIVDDNENNKIQVDELIALYKHLLQ